MRSLRRRGIALNREADDGVCGQWPIGAAPPFGADASARDVEDVLANASIPDRHLWDTCFMGRARLDIGRHVLVTGMAGSGKSTFSRALSTKTGLPVIHLDVHFWKPGWVAPSDGEWREKQRSLLAGDAWIVDGNYHETLDLQLERAETVVFLDTPWWVCVARAFARGLRKPGGELPEGCDDSLWRRLRDEWRLVFVIWRNRRTEPERDLAIISEHGRHAALHVLGSKRAATEFLDALDGD